MPIQLRKFFSVDDPTFLATALAVVSVPLWARPWGWSCVPPNLEGNWAILMTSQAGAAVVFASQRGPLAGATLIGLILLGAPWLLSDGGGWWHQLFFALPVLADRVLDSQMITLLALWSQLAIALALIAKCVRPSMRFDSLLAWACLATAAAVTMQYAGEHVIGGFRGTRADHVIVILLFASPAIVLPGMLWRLVRLGDAPAVVMGVSTIALAATVWPVIDRGRHTFADIGLLIAVAGSGTAWAVLRRKFFTPAADVRGFAVVTPAA